MIWCNKESMWACDIERTWSICLSIRSSLSMLTFARLHSSSTVSVGSFCFIGPLDRSINSKFFISFVHDRFVDTHWKIVMLELTKVILIRKSSVSLFYYMIADISSNTMRSKPINQINTRKKSDCINKAISETPKEVCSYNNWTAYRMKLTHC